MSPKSWDLLTNQRKLQFHHSMDWRSKSPALSPIAMSLMGNPKFLVSKMSATCERSFDVAHFSSSLEGECKGTSTSCWEESRSFLSGTASELSVKGSNCGLASGVEPLSGGAGRFSILSTSFCSRVCHEPSSLFSGNSACKLSFKNGSHCGFASWVEPLGETGLSSLSFSATFFCSRVGHEPRSLCSGNSACKLSFKDGSHCGFASSVEPLGETGLSSLSFSATFFCSRVCHEPRSLLSGNVACKLSFKDGSHCGFASSVEPLGESGLSSLSFSATFFCSRVCQEPRSLFSGNSACKLSFKDGSHCGFASSVEPLGETGLSSLSFSATFFCSRVGHEPSSLFSGNSACKLSFKDGSHCGFASSVEPLGETGLSSLSFSATFFCSRVCHEPSWLFSGNSACKLSFKDGSHCGFASSVEPLGETGLSSLSFSATFFCSRVCHEPRSLFSGNSACKLSFKDGSHCGFASSVEPLVTAICSRMAFCQQCYHFCCVVVYVCVCVHIYIYTQLYTSH